MLGDEKLFYKNTACSKKNMACSLENKWGSFEIRGVEKYLFLYNYFETTGNMVMKLNILLKLTHPKIVLLVNGVSNMIRREY